MEAWRVCLGQGIMGTGAEVGRVVGPGGRVVVVLVEFVEFG